MNVIFASRNPEFHRKGIDVKENYPRVFSYRNSLQVRLGKWFHLSPRVQEIPQKQDTRIQETKPDIEHKQDDLGMREVRDELYNRCQNQGWVKFSREAGVSYCWFCGRSLKDHASNL